MTRRFLKQGNHCDPLLDLGNSASLEANAVSHMEPKIHFTSLIFLRLLVSLTLIKVSIINASKSNKMDLLKFKVKPKL